MDNHSITDSLEEVIKNPTLVRPNRAELRSILAEVYDESHGIKFYDESAAGIDYIRLHPAEDISKTSHLYETIRLFARRRVSHYYGCSITEFLELPRDISDVILETCAELQKPLENPTEPPEE